MKKPIIAMLWMEGPLSFLEHLCAKSFLDAGHQLIMYHYGPLENVPDGAEMVDAGEILPRTTYVTHERTGSPAPHADKFRYRMLAASENTIWADTDAYCMRPFQMHAGHFYGWESDRHVNNGVLSLHKDSPTLRGLIDFTSDEYAIPTWYGEEYTAELEQAKARGEPLSAGQQPWGVWGPHALTHFLRQTGEIENALPRDRLYPVSFKDRRLLLKRNFDLSGYIGEETLSVHLYGRRMRSRLVEKEGGAPHPKSLLGQLLIKHGIDPAKAPLRPKPRPQTSDAAPKSAAIHSFTSLARERDGRGIRNLTDIADKYGSDRGSAKLRFTELYQMLFAPYQDKAIDLLEINDRAQRNHANDATDNARQVFGSLEIWQDYFENGQIHIADGGDYDASNCARFKFHQYSADNFLALERPLFASSTAFDFVIDKGSQASHAQQAAFLQLFDSVKSGGLYVVEGLRWQPATQERPGITKTAALFQSYIRTGVFAHSSAETEAAFNAMRCDISGCFIFQAQFDKSNRDQLLVVHKR